jgi:chlorobactene glucosyltransferase
VLFWAYVEVGLGFFFLTFCITNIIWMKAHSKKIVTYDGPKISVLVPARNEETYIKNCLDSLLNQSYKNYDILVLNDNSEDSTLKILREYEKNYPGKLRCFDGKPLPGDWQGKCFAMHQLVGYADGEFMLFTDADTVHSPDSVAYAVANLVQSKADMISGYIHQELHTPGERFTVPIMFMLTNFIVLMPLDKILKNPMFAAAIGQYIAVRSSALRAIGGYTSVKKMTTEDMYLARKMKKEGYKTLFINAEHTAKCRMYTSYREAVNGIGKNIFDFFEKRTPVLVVIFFAIAVFIAFPSFVSLYQFILCAFFNKPLDMFSLCLFAHFILIFLTWLAVFINQKLPLLTALVYPLLFINLLFMAAHSWYKSTFGNGYIWKGRIIK